MALKVAEGSDPHILLPALASVLQEFEPTAEILTEVKAVDTLRKCRGSYFTSVPVKIPDILGP